jgi:hypothetical protein
MSHVAFQRKLNPAREKVELHPWPAGEFVDIPAAESYYE